MKCTCDRCQGQGLINCPECNGDGAYECGIERMALDTGMENYRELWELQLDAKRVTKQAEELMKLNPARKQSYYEQLQGCLETINKQADKVAKRKQRTECPIS